MSNITQFFSTGVPDTNFATAALGSCVKVPDVILSPLICKAGGVAHIVAPAISQVSRTWYCREDAIATAVQLTCAVGWFIPTVQQLQNPGYCCRTFWDSFCSTHYWNSTEGSATNACFVYFVNGAPGLNNKSLASCVRAFRQVTY